jgi:NADH:ubiquinone oxidoreductase subunit F (NADH-binding)
MAEQALNSMEFFRNESCGKCVPCRLGSQKLVSLGTEIVGGRISAERWKNELWPLIREASTAIEQASICGLGRSVPVPLRTVAKFFEEDLARHLSAKGSAGKHEAKRWR